MCSHLSEKPSKDIFWGPDKFQNHKNEVRKDEKERAKRKKTGRREKSGCSSSGCSLNVYHG